MSRKEARKSPFLECEEYSDAKKGPHAATRLGR